MLLPILCLPPSRRWKMNAERDTRSEARERPSHRSVDRLSPELRGDKFILLSMEGKLLGPELSRIRSELALPLERLDTELPHDLPAGYLWRQRRSLPAFPLPPGARSPAELRSSSEVLCAGQFPAGLRELVPGMQAPASPGRRSPRTRHRSALAAEAGGCGRHPRGGGGGEGSAGP
ncbi:uncharacterized protein ACNFOS_012867 [Eudromia elegans]